MSFRTQKISQMTPKGANLAATDLIEVSTIESGSYVTRSITGQELIDAVPSAPQEVQSYANLAAFPVTGVVDTIYIAEDTNKTYRWTGSVYVEISATASTAWGGITGTLSAQTDLQSALNAKQDTLSLTTTGSSGASTLVGATLNVPTYTLAGLGGVPTTRTLTINGTALDLSADRSWTIATGLTIGSTAIASGTVGRVLFQGTGNVLQQSANLFWDNTNGYLGIGTSSPTTTLDVNGTIRVSSTGAYGISITRSGTTGVAQQMFNNGSTLYFGVQSSTNGSFLFADGSLAYAVSFGSGSNTATQFGTNNIIRQTIFNNGNVLLHNGGTPTDAGFKLDVNGTARVVGNSFFATTSGTLASGTTTVVNMQYSEVPKLYVSGGSYLNGTIQLGTSNIRISGNNISWENTGITNNLPEWRADATGIKFGNYNSLPLRISVGGTENARFFSTGNVGINTTTDAGYRLDVNGTARVQSDMLVNGITVGKGANAVTQNTAVGLSALTSNTTGFDNAAFGWSSARNLTTGLFHSAFGSGALYTSSTGAHNSAFGYVCLYSSVGSRNSAFGSASFYSLSSGNDNSALGNNAGRYITGGATANTTSNTSIFIGSDTKSLADNQSNQIVIGYNETGLGSNTTIIGNSSTILTALRGSLISGGTSVNASAQVQIDSTTKGFLPPRMTTTQKNAIASPATGLQVFDTTLNQMSYYNGTTWVNI